MIKNEHKLISLLILGILMTIGFAAVTYAADDEPPALTIDIPEDEEAPPSVEINIPAEEGDTDGPPSLDLSLPDNIRITSHDVYPEGFNPLNTETEISYSISDDAEMTVKIVDEDEDTVVVLVDNEDEDEGSHVIEWDGANTSDVLVDPGDYQYEIIAKHPDTHEIEDMAEGDITVIYTSTTPRPSGQQGSGVDQIQARATVALQNSATGSVSETGPGILIYGLLPIAGYILARKKIKK